MPWPWLPALAQTAPAARSAASRPRDQVVRAAQLVGAADLQVLALEPDPRAGGVRQPFAGLQRGGDGDARELRRRALDECGQVHAPDDPRCGRRRQAVRGLSGCGCCQSAGTRPAGPGTGWSSGRWVGAASSGPVSAVPARSPRTSPRRARSSARRDGRTRAACAVACWAGEESQQPTWPHCAHRRRCTHQPPAASHSTHPVPDGVAAGSMPFVTVLRRYSSSVRARSFQSGRCGSVRGSRGSNA